jgi:hypothetical protein
MENELSALWKYTHKLENILVQSLKEKNKFKMSIKDKLKK